MEFGAALIGPTVSEAPASIAGLWLVSYDSGQKVTLAVFANGRTRLSTEGRVVEGALAAATVKGSRVMFNHRLDPRATQGAYELLVIPSEGLLDIERHRPGMSAVFGTGRRVWFRAEAYRPVAPEFLKASCEFSSLPPGCRAQPAVVAFLNMSCISCRTSVCALRTSLLQTASEIVANSVDVATLGCPQASKAAAIVLMQHYGREALPNEEMLRECKAGAAMERSVTPSLSPFPFHFEDLELYSRFRPALVDPPCSGEVGAEMSPRVDVEAQELPVPGNRLTGSLGWFATLKVWTLPTAPAMLPREADLVTAQCPVIASDVQLASRCRRRVSRVRAGSVGELSVHTPLDWRCPTNGTAGRGGRKYEADYRGCASAHGTWGKRIEGRLKCVTVVVAELLGLRPGDRVLDWGSGCGWTLTWLRMLYGVEGYGIDAAAANIAWATTRSAGQFCLWSSPDLTWIPDAAFDAVVTYWAMYHLRSPDEQCRVARQLIAKLRPGGRAWFGGNCPSPNLNIGNTPMSELAWRRCLRRPMGNFGLEVEFVPDAELFTVSGAPAPEDNDNPGNYLFWPPVFSVIVRKFIKKNCLIR